MKVLVALFVLIAVVEFGDAKRAANRGPSNGGGSSNPPGVARCQSIPVCPPYCSLDVTGPCPRCDCTGFCDVNCVGDSCKIVRNGNACACACASGDDDDAGTSGSCSITCPGGCKAIANNGQCYCLCNGNDGDDVCVIDCPPQCEVTRDSNGNCQCVCF
ncbi:spider silk-constituting element SpiCE-NMa2A1 [Trichonephila inaurata madagascariensis]|uniref:Spider silk-constituting element SpiCE-NMa2A1 n=1 Tax=Trichonephila inaurata madagascariensis TaxID=2747483 RepID=A0A8X6MLZ0_9ARAC|nr:spider silk-constituting element SpiCE-NMa2A1 [Trichonephila inaurata madagascariensis]